MATLYTLESRNTMRTWLLMGLFAVLITGLGYALSVVYQNVDLLYFALIFSIILNIGSYWYSDKIALGLSGARPISPATEATPANERELIRIVENLSITAGLPMPRVYIIDDVAPNAFATGRNKEHAAIAVTSGLLDILERNELEGVIAHELAHIGNKDILLGTIIVTLVGIFSIISDMFIRSSFGFGRSRGDNEKGGGPLMILGIIFIVLSPLFAQLLQLAISRKREFLADATGALLTRYPEGLASALEKIHSHSAPLQRASHATAHLFISDPFDEGDESRSSEKGSSFGQKIGALFSTHPLAAERIAALRGMKK